MTRVYTRCNSGHYFVGSSCPLDGWSSEASKVISATAEDLARKGEPLTVQALKRAGLDPTALARCLVVDFGDENSAFDLVAPEGYVVGGQWIPSRDFDWRFT